MSVRSLASFALAAALAVGPSYGCAPMDAGDTHEPAGGAVDLDLSGAPLEEVDAHETSPETAAAPAVVGTPSEVTVTTPLGARRLRVVEVDGLAVADGDIVLGPMHVVAAGSATAAGRWPGGVVPYTIEPALPSPERVSDAIAHWQSRVGVRFVRRTNETSWITFRHSTSCQSNVGRIGGQQYIDLARTCGTGSVMHEIGHALGLWHEQSRSDRDGYVKVLTENIHPGALGNFDKTPFASVGSYDLGSIMHYGSYDFSANGKPTLTRLDGTTFSANRTALSAGDISGVRAIYASEGLGQSPVVAPTTAKATTNLNLRRGPGTSFSVLGTIPKGATVSRTGGTENGFDEVVYAGDTGWASAKYLQ